MPDKLDVLLGLAGAPDSSESLIEQTLQTITAKDLRAPQVLLEKFSKLGAEEGRRQFLEEYDQLTKRFGAEAARRIVADTKALGNKRLSEIAREHSDATRKQAVLECGLKHAEAVNAVFEKGAIIFKPRPFILGNARLKTHEILEQINSDRRGLLGDVIGASEIPPKEQFLELHRSLIKSAKFDIRSIAVDDINPNAEFSYELEADGLLVLPYPLCWFEWDIEPDYTVGALITDGLEISSLVRVNGAGWCKWVSMPLDNPKLFPDHVELVCRAALVLLNSRSAEKTQIEVSASLNRRREKGGNPPLFSHTVVEIKGVLLNHESGVAVRTHRSPRMHWRRGHLRRLRNADGSVRRVTVIAPMLVGRAELGQIEHDYIVATRGTVNAL